MAKHSIQTFVANILFIFKYIYLYICISVTNTRLIRIAMCATTLTATRYLHRTRCAVHLASLTYIIISVQNSVISISP
jgi:hypothetical protein